MYKRQPEGLRWATELALEVYRDPDAWLSIVTAGMNRDFSWEKQAELYSKLYDRLATREGVPG